MFKRRRVLNGQVEQSFEGILNEHTINGYISTHIHKTNRFNWTDLDNGPS